MSENERGQLIVYQSSDGEIKLDVRLQDETVWLTQPMMAELFQTTQQNISQHILNIYEEGELVPEATHKKFLSVRQERARQVQRNLDFYNLDMIISVGYRVKSAVATRFRIWATERLKEYLVKGFTLNDERLKEPEGGRYFEELLARIRDWAGRLDQFLSMTGRELLAHAGQISHEAAIAKAHEEYDSFLIKQLNEPTDAERHFIEAERELKQIDASRRKETE